VELGKRQALQRLFEHGGDINSAAAAFPEAPTPWIDLSTGINPVAYSLPVLPPEAWTRLPSPADLASLEAAAAARYGAAPEAVAAAPGTQALIQALPRLFPAARVAILGPTYGGHETAWRAAGAEVVAVRDARDLEGASHIVVVSPNNPDGRWLSLDTLHGLAARAAARRGLLVVDAAFADFEPESAAAGPATVVLRSFGKAYGLAGLRLGFALAPAEMAARLREALGPWPVSGASIAIGRQALRDPAWLAETRTRLEQDARWLDATLARAGFDILGGTALFRLGQRDDAAEAFARLAGAGVLTRPFRSAPSWLRFGLPAPAHRERVEAALRTCR
jgi:cobalamin biosynthetic protein CobC